MEKIGLLLSGFFGRFTYPKTARIVNSNSIMMPAIENVNEIDYRAISPDKTLNRKDSNL